jgi:hypothetical protein
MAAKSAYIPMLENVLQKLESKLKKEQILLQNMLVTDVLHYKIYELS